MSQLFTDDLTSTGTSAATTVPPGDFNVSITGNGVGTVVLERKFSGSSVWGAVKTYTGNVEEAGYEPEYQTQYRFNCTAYTSGTFTVRLGGNTN